MDDFTAAWNRWQRDCLAEYNERYGEERQYYEPPGEHHDPSEVVEFSEAGHAYPHSAWGMGFLSHAVTPWLNSRHFRER